MSRGEPPTKRPRDATTHGFWLLYNQAPGMAWPTREEGPFHEDWRNSWGAPFMYSKVYVPGGHLGRGSGVPFALVASDGCHDRSTDPCGYRYRGEGNEQYCAQSAYCWVKHPYPALGDTAM